MIRSYLFLFAGTYLWSAASGSILYAMGAFFIEDFFRCLTSTFLTTLFFVMLVGRRFLHRRLSEYTPLFLFLFPLPVAFVLFVLFTLIAL